ncbi:hypothetical protein Pla108_09830 [Botrimarina colliarenosi]|uniref:TIGR03545 family protein n=1 Tax=Botrimarina colliarenosi TaxID=2528001 RepID=A0A5C6AK57_9BACT|nr:TIGR03545 family protein [Botrimarina colliarenosi]TWU00040.1 hypothetical protein Pla108_09830 [Botrimarina colliarenosi]
MTRYIRLGYLVPRLVLLVVLFCLLEFGSGWALKRAMIAGGQAAIGARVEVDRADVSVVETRATLTGLRIANPQRPMENLLEAEKIEIDFESDSLLRRKAIADHGSVRGLRFGTPRETSGALNPDDEQASTAPGWLGDAAKQAVDQAAEKWIASLEAKLSGEYDDFESVRLAQDLSKRWPERFAAVAADAKALQAEVELLRDQAKEARANPLRNAEFLAKAPERVAQLRGRLANLHAELASLPTDVAADRRRVDQARLADETRLRERLQIDQLDPQSLTSQLLGERMTGAVRDVVGWVRWTREMVPATKPGRSVTPRDRGVDVHFVGVRQRPDLLIRQLEIAGSARLAGRPVELSGVVTDFTTSPALHGEPMRLTLHTTGGLPLEVRATIDRTGPQPIEELIVDCPTLDLPKTELGNAAKFALTMAPSTSSLSVSIRVEGERLSGDVQLIQDRVALTPTVGPSAGPLVTRLGGAVGERLANIARPATRVTLSGTLNDPHMALWSTLGPAVAESLETAAVTLARDEAERQLASTKQKVAGELASLERKLDEAMTKLTAQVDAPRLEIERLASGWIGEQLGRGTFSFEQLGKRLPTAESLFK